MKFPMPREFQAILEQEAGEDFAHWARQSFVKGDLEQAAKEQQTPAMHYKIARQQIMGIEE